VSNYDPFPGSPMGDERRVFIPTPSSGPSAPPRSPAPPGPAGPRPGPVAPGRGPYADRPPTAPPWRRPGGPGGPSRPGGPGTRPAPPGRGPQKPWFRRVRWRRVLLVLLILLIVGVFALYWYANSIFGRIERVQVSEVLSDGGSGTNYLIVGSDSRENLDPNDPVAAGAPAGQRADTIMVLHVGGDGAKILSVPRDLYVTIAETGDQQKINAAYNGGPTRLIQTVSDSLGIPIHRYMEVDFVSFGGLVDALGGVTINFPHPAFDANSGLNVTETGPVELDGQQALAYVRSRNYTEIIDGQEVTDQTGDLGRIRRQQAFLTAVFGKLGDARNPFTLLASASNLADGLRIDDEMTLWDAMRLAWRIRGLDPAPQELPVTPDRNESGAVLILQEDEAQPILEQFR
jgi:LCP family protein required for cell wall assembly